MSLSPSRHPRPWTRAASLAAGIVAFVPIVAQGQTLFDFSGGSYGQTFDGSGSALPVGWGFGQGVAFASTTISSTQTGGTVGAGILAGSSAGGAYHFVNGTAGVSTERAIGFLTTGSFSNNRDIIFGFRNTTGLSITSLALSFNYEKYRSGFSAREWSFFGSDSDSNWGSAILNGAESYAGDLSNNDVLNPPVSVTKSVSISGLNIAPNEDYYFRWNYGGTGTGSGGQALGLDNLTFSATLTGGPLYWDTNGDSSGIGGAGAWDAGSLNWTTASDGTSSTIAPDASRNLVFGGAGGAVTVGAGAVANNGLTFASSGYSFSGGTIGFAGSITISNGTHTATISSAISGASGITKTGLGKLVLAGTNVFSGGLTLAGGTVEISADAALGASASGLTLGGGTFKTTASISLAAGRSVSGGGVLDIAPSTTLDVTGSASIGDIVLRNTGALRLSGVSPDVASLTIEEPGSIVGGLSPIDLGGPVTSTHASGTATIMAALNFGAVLHTFTIGNGLSAIDVLLSGNLTGTAGARLLKVGAGTLSLSGNNSGLVGTIQLGTASADGGTLSILSSSALGFSGSLELHSGTLRALSPSTIAATVTVDFSDSTALGTTFAGSAIDFLGGAQFSGGGTHTVVAESDVSIAGAVSGSANSFILRGAGSLTLKSGGSFTGDITVDAGELIVNGGFTAATRPEIVVLPAGILGGSLASGSLGALIADGGMISPGSSVDMTGALSATASGFALDIRTGGGLALQIGGVSVNDYDRISANGQVRLAGDLLLSLINGFLPVDGAVFTIISNDAGDAVTGTFSALPQLATVVTGGASFTIRYDGGDGNDVTLTAIPEPGVGALLLAGAAFSLIRRRPRFVGLH